MSRPEILFQDRRFIIINKPAGLPVYAGRAGGASVEDFFPLWGQGKTGPWLAHRLDQDTAGCLVLALKKSALLAAQQLFAANTVQKTYWALVRGVPATQSGTINMALAKLTTGRSWKMQAVSNGLPATTQWQLKGQGDGFSWLELHPKTGRTHQIRVHCAALGHPIMGDAVYGGGQGALCLLARHIHLPLEPAAFATAPVPPHMQQFMLQAGFHAQ